MNNRKQFWFEAGLLALILVIVFLPLVGQLRYFKDDWYYIYDGIAGGPGVFHDMFSMDRPARGYFFEAAFGLLGPEPLGWQLGAFAWRLISAVGALWIFKVLWPAERRLPFLAALLFSIYPGYSWWVSAVEYQPMMASLALQVVSIALSLQALRAARRPARAAYVFGAIVTGWAYIALVDYAIGMEALRLIAMLIVAARSKQPAGKMMVHQGWWAALIPLGFLGWKVFLFEGQRKATDISAQLGVFLEAPGRVIKDWILNLYSSLINMSLTAWTSQIVTHFENLRMRDAAAGALLAAAVVGVLWVWRWATSSSGRQDEPESVREALLAGAIGMTLGVLPVVLANRTVDIHSYAHYGSPASMAAGIFLAGLILRLQSPRLRWGILCAVVFSASAAHYGIAQSAIREEVALQEFWWQVSWRMPGVQPGALLAVHYPDAELMDDGAGRRQAPNLIYFPGPAVQAAPVVYPVGAVAINAEHLQMIMDQADTARDGYRSHVVNLDFSNVLVITQPTPGSCVHVLDGRRPLLSIEDPALVQMAAPYSRVDNVLTHVPPAVPPVFAFGTEPERGWCYYFQRAELAAQQEDWSIVADLGEQAGRLGLYPEDRAEWLPFFHAYALTGNLDQLERISQKLVGGRQLREQACARLRSAQGTLTPDVLTFHQTYCQ